MKLKTIFELGRRFIKPMPKKQEVTWAEFVMWLQGKTVTRMTEDAGTTWLEFTDGTKAVLENEIEHIQGYSEVTPGYDTMLPTKITIEES